MLPVRQIIYSVMCPDYLRRVGPRETAIMKLPLTITVKSANRSINWISSFKALHTELLKVSLTGPSSAPIALDSSVLSHLVI